MPIRNFGAGTPRLSEGIIVSGSSATSYAIYASGSVEAEEIALDKSSEPAIVFSMDGDARSKIFINSSNNLEIKQQYTNKHIVFKVLDAGTTREAFRMDGAIPEVVVNQTGDSLVDFRVESDNNTHMMYVDGGNDVVGINHSSPASTLTVGGSLSLRVTNINAANDPGTTYTIQNTECVILVNTRPQGEGGIDSAITLTLPDASDNPGMLITVKDAAGHANVNNIVVARAGSDTIEGVATTLTLNNVAQKTTLISDGISIWSEIGN